MKKGMVAVLSSIGGAVLTAAGFKKYFDDKITHNSKMADKHLSLYLMMNQWVKVKQENKSISEYLEKNGYKEIAIYGMNYVGETLLSELENSNIVVKYGIDRNAAAIFSDIDVLTPDDELAPVDAVIVTAITFFDVIEEKLSQKLDCAILSMDDILYEV